MSEELMAVQMGAAGGGTVAAIRTDGLRHPCFLIGIPRGVLRAAGNDRLDLLHRLSTNALASLSPGAARPTVFVTEKGRIIDEVQVLAREEDALLVTSPGMSGLLAAWIGKFTIMEDVRVADAGNALRTFAVGGPEATAFLQRGIPGLRVPEAGSWEELPEFSGMIWTAGGYGTPMILVASGEADRLVRCLTSAGCRVLPAEAFPVFRVIHGIPGIGHEILAAYHPLEAGLRHAVSFTKGCYIGQEVIARLDTYDRVQRRLAGVRLPSMPAEQPAELLSAGQPAGTLTTAAPLEDSVIGLALVRRDVPDGAVVTVRGGVEGEEIAGDVVPFSMLSGPDLP